MPLPSFSMTIQTEIQIVHRHKQPSKFDRNTLLCHLSSLCQDLNMEFIDIDYILDTIEKGLPNTITSKELVDLTAETIASLTTKYYQYSTLAARVLEFYLQKILPSKFSDNIVQLYKFEPDHNKQSKHLISKNLFSAVMMNKGVIDSAIDHSRDFQIDYFGFRTLERSYFLRINEEVHETPQFLFMRVALGIHFENIDKALETYQLMSEKYFIHASPTLFNSGTDFSNLSSCFLVAMNDDSIEGIFKTIYETALISKCAGGIGLHVSNIRSSGTYISGTNGTSSGLVPMLRVFNNTAKYVDQGGNKRPGAFCVYLEPWHSDVFEFLNLRKNHGKEELRARDLFYALWIPDLFMQKVENNEEWCLFSENQCPGLEDAYGEDFKELYEKYESENKYLKKVKAQKLWHAILVAQTETGNPFLLYKDACNKKSNQKNLGTIKSSNLCCEIVEYSSQDETAVCNLASIALPSFVNEDRKGVDFKKMHEVTKIVIKNLDKIIDIGSYPLEKCKNSNQKHRPVGLGVQGLADLFFILRMPFGSEKSRKLNVQIFETMYHGALEASVELAVEKGKYETYNGSPISKGLLQYDLWGKNPTDLWDWKALKEKISQHGVRNSLLIALMPTASTSQILGYNECFEPVTSNIYTRRVLSGEYQVVNKYLVEDLSQLGLWNDDLKDKIIANNGSILNIDNIPEDIKELYKTVWEMSQKIIIDLAADRAPFVDQSQSMNLFMNNVSFSKLTSMHFYAWKKGLKTGIYYLRTQSASSAIKFTLDAEIFKKRKLESVSEDDDLNQIKEDNKRRILFDDSDTDCNSVNIYDDTVISCSLKDPENCDSCSA